MTGPITTDSILLEDILRTTCESIEHLARSIRGEFKSGPIVHREVEIAESTLDAILVLLEFHSNESIRQAYTETVQLLRAGKKLDFTPQELTARKNLRVSADPLPTDEVLDEVMDIIVDYGKRVQERERKKQDERKASDEKAGSQ